MYKIHNKNEKQGKRGNIENIKQRWKIRGDILYDKIDNEI